MNNNNVNSSGTHGSEGASRFMKSYSSMMEDKGLEQQVTSGIRDSRITSRNHSGHDDRNTAQKISKQQQLIRHQNQLLGEKPISHQTLSIENSTTDSSRIDSANNKTHQDHFLKWTFALLLGGMILGILLPKNPHLPSPTWRILSSIIGYTYFLAWSASFYPQIFMNYHRKTTRGLSVDFCVLNVLGYVCYMLYTTNFYWNKWVIDAYRNRMSVGSSSSSMGAVGGDNNGSLKHPEVTVQGNDVAFSIHALLMATITLSQIGIYDTFTVRHPSKRVYIIILSTFVFCALYLLYTWIFQGKIDFLGFLYVLGSI